MPRLQWQPIKNLLRLHKFRLRREIYNCQTSRAHFIVAPGYRAAGVINWDWWSRPDAQAYVIEQIAWLAKNIDRSGDAETTLAAN